MTIILIVFLTLLIFPVKKTVFSENQPDFSISANNRYFQSGSLVSLTSVEEPVITLQNYGVKDKGTATITLYQTNESVLLANLLHDKENKKLRQEPDFSKLQQIATQDVNIYPGNLINKISLPLEKSGIWVLKVDFSNTTNYFFLTRSENGVLVKEGDKEYIFWAQNFRTKRSVSKGTIKLYNLLGSVKELASADFDTEGISTIPLNGDADVGVVEFGKDVVILPINLRDFNYNYQAFTKDQSEKKYFIFTDRPIYKPGDTVYFKAIIRDDDDAVYTKPSGNVKVSIVKDYGEDPVIEKEFPISLDGTVFGEYKISKDSPTGYYTLRIADSEKSSNSVNFQVQNYDKPEYSLSLSSGKTELINQDRSSAKIEAQYFFGQPVNNKKIKYKILSTNYFNFEFFSQNIHVAPDDYFYGFWGADLVTEGQINLDTNGQATINFEAKIPPDKPQPSDGSYYEPHAGHNQVFSVMAMLDDGSGNSAFAKKNILVYAGEFDIFRKEGSQTIRTGEQAELPLILTPHFKAQVNNINLTAGVHRENWVLDSQQQDQQYPKYKKEEEDLPQLGAVTNSSGEATLSFIPQKVGYYTLTVNAKDKRGNLVSKAFHFYVSSDTESYNTSAYSSSKLAVITDKEQYQPNQTVKVTVLSEIPDTDIFLAIERGKVRRYIVVRLQGKSGAVDVPLQNNDIPNIYLDASSFLQSDFVSDLKKINISIESKILKLNIKTDKQRYGPGEFVGLDIISTDSLGNPVIADTAIWALDKALLELSDYKTDVVNAFWGDRYNSTSQSYSLEGISSGGGGGGGCFSKDTKVLLSDKTSKRIDQIKTSDVVLSSNSNGQLTEAKVLGIHKVKVDGYLIINTDLKITPNHKIWVNGTWKEAGSIQIGDRLRDFSGSEIQVRSLEWQKGAFEVYNLEVESTHTFFANSFLVHNEKGGDRQVFKDLAYWNPSVHTDSSGHAQVKFQLPDNLTTWVISTIASTDNTEVGQNRAEIIVQKDVFIRPVLPNILRVGDWVNLGALVHNFTSQTEELEVSLQTDQFLKQNSSQKQRILLKPADSKQVFWSVSADSESDNAKLIFSVQSVKDNKTLDSATVNLSVKPFEFLEKQVQAGQGSVSFPVLISGDVDKNKGGLTLTLSPTLLGPVLESMKFLLGYGYGCVEQTVSRLVSAILVKNNPQFFAKALQDKNVDDIINKSLLRLSNLQHSDGGFSWWQYGKSNYFITAYSVENLVAAKSLGFKVSSEILKQMKYFLEKDSVYNSQTLQDEKLDQQSEIARIYALSLLKSDKGKVLLDQFDNLTPDMLSLAVLANIQNGFKDPQTNGLNKLLSLKKVVGDDIYFEAGDEKNFGSEEASTALAIRAMLAGGAPDGDIVSSVRYLTRGKKNEYFGNTFGTAQAIKAIVEFSKNFKENNPDFSYTVSIDDKQLAQGRVSDIQSEIPIIKMPLSEAKLGSTLQISQNGTGQLYSNFEVAAYNVNRKAMALDQGFSVRRTYENADGKKDIRVGDIVKVKITVSGQAQKYYAVVKDELPAGLVPINTVLNNEEYFIFDEPSSSPEPTPESVPFDVTDTEITENGIILSIHQINSGASTFTYKARAVSSGKFMAPPAQVELMYNPKVYGRSGADSLEVQGTSILPNIDVISFTLRYKILLVGSVVLVLSALIVGFLIRRRQIAN